MSQDLKGGGTRGEQVLEPVSNPPLVWGVPGPQGGELFGS